MHFVDVFDIDPTHDFFHRHATEFDAGEQVGSESSEMLPHQATHLGARSSRFQKQSANCGKRGADISEGPYRRPRRIIRREQKQMATAASRSQTIRRDTGGKCRSRACEGRRGSGSVNLPAARFNQYNVSVLQGSSSSLHRDFARRLAQKFGGGRVLVLGENAGAAEAERDLH